MPTGGIDIGIGAALTDAVGATAGTLIADAGVGALGGAALGGIEGAVTGGNVGKGILHGAEGGALTGGGIGLGGDLLGGTIGTTAADALGGAAGGALGGVVTGQNPLVSAAEGGISGGIAGALSPSGAPTSTPSAGTVGGGAAGAGGGAAPTSVDISQGFGPDATVLSQGFGADANGISPSLQSASQAINNSGSLSTTGSPATSSNLPGTPGVGSGLGSEFAQGAGGTPSLSAPTVDSLASASSAAAAPTATPNSFSQFASNPTFANAGNILTSNPGALISGAGLGLDVLKGNKESGAEKNLKEEASQLGQQGSQLEGYLQSGTLPPGLKSGIDQATASAKATIRSRYASMGLSGSSAEQQELGAVDQRAQEQAAQLGMQLLNTGIGETGMASQLYQTLLGDSLKNDSGLSTAISNFASAAAGGGGLNVRGGQNPNLQLP